MNATLKEAISLNNSNHGPISYRFRDRRRFSRKSQNFPTPCILRPHPPLKGFSSELDTGAGVIKLEWYGYRTDKEFDDIFSRLDTIHERAWQTDGHQVTAKTALAHSVARWKPVYGTAYNIGALSRVLDLSRLFASPHILSACSQCRFWTVNFDEMTLYGKRKFFKSRMPSLLRGEVKGNFLCSLYTPKMFQLRLSNLAWWPILGNFYGSVAPHPPR